MDAPMMKKTIQLQSSLADYNRDLTEWIKSNVTKNPERYLP